MESIRADHHVRGLDDGVGGLALFQLQLGDGFVGDRGGDGGAARRQHDVRGGRPFLDAGDAAFDDVARAEPHGGGGGSSVMPARRSRSLPRNIVPPPAPEYGLDKKRIIPELGT